MFKHNALIYVSLDFVGGEKIARTLIGKISECGEIMGISSVYKRYVSESRVDLSARLEFVIHFETSMSVEQSVHLALSLTDHVENKLPRKSNTQIILLAFDRVVMMSPKLTLPYPTLHTDPLIIRCASEVWGTYEHPIILRTLGEISRTASSALAVEFYIQGKSLVDF